MSEQIDMPRLEHFAKFLYGEDTIVWYVPRDCRRVAMSVGDVWEDIKLEVYGLDVPDIGLVKIHIGYSREAKLAFVGVHKGES